MKRSCSLRHLMLKMSFFILSGLFLFLCSCATSRFLGSKKEQPFTLQPYKEVILSNGLKVLLIEDHSLPYFTMKLLVKAGSNEDPLTYSGLGTVVGELLDKGTSHQTALALADQMGQIGSSLSVDVTNDFTLISATTLSQHQEKLTQLFSAMVTEPSFAESEVTRVKKQLLSVLQKSVDNPSDLAEFAYNAYLYGTHPYARRTLGRKRDVQNLRRKSIIKYYLTYYRPNNAQLAVIGDFGPDIVNSLETVFKQWSSREVKPLEMPQVAEEKGLQIELVEKEDLAQTQLRIGHVGVKRTDPDYLALKVASTVLGDGFNSRLMNEIRVKRGLTYSISSFFEGRKDKGPFVVSTFSRNEKVGETIQETIKILKEIVEKGVTEEEVKAAKALMRGRFPRMLETAERLGQTLLGLNFYGLPDTEITEYLSKLDQIKTSDVNQAIKKHFYSNDLKVLAYGPKKILEQLRTIAVVQIKPYKEFIQ